MMNQNNIFKPGSQPAHIEPSEQLQPQGRDLEREKDKFPQRCILDSLLSQPVTTKSSEMMRNTYETPKPKPASTAYEHRQVPINLKSIMLEHCYARPYNWRPDANFLRPTKTLFINQEAKKKQFEQEIDVDRVSVVDSPLIYDFTKAKKLMDECEKHVSGLRDGPEWDDWENNVPKIGWSQVQHNMFSSVVDIFKEDRLARLGCSGFQNEATIRRLTIDKSVKRFRRLIAKYTWDVKLVQWLHTVLVEYMSAPYIAAYLDLLQSLRYKLPTFVDKLIGGPCTRFGGPLSTENIFQLIKRVWDPVAFSLGQDKAKKLPGNPVIIIVPSGSTLANNTHSKRLSRWINLFANIAAVITVHNTGCSRKASLATCVDQMLIAVRTRVQEVKNEYPSRPIILVGFNSGAALALQVAQIESVMCTVSLGFSIYTAEGNRGDPEDSLLELQSPVLFVIGQLATTVLQEHMEDIRERMRVETGLLVVGGADDYLRVANKIKKSEAITQSIIDRCIVDEVADFVSGLLLSPYPPQIRQSPSCVPPEMAIKRPKERKRNNSNGSSLDSEPPSPTPRIHRPVGRPPGSKAKSKLDAKWQALQQGIPSSPSNSNSITPPNPPSTPESYVDADFSLIKDKTLPTNTQQQQTTNAKLQAMGLYPGNIQLTKSLTGGVRTIPPNTHPNPIANPKQIKVLDNITLTSAMSGKLMQTLNRPDLHKMAQIPPQCASTYGSNMVLMPDGRYKSAPPAMRGNTLLNSPLAKLLTRPANPTLNQQLLKQHLTSTSKTPSARASLTKYITSKKQLQNNRPKQVKKMPYMPNQGVLPPPTNLTSQDIMDLPIIFADDNQMLANNTIQPLSAPAHHQPQHIPGHYTNPQTQIRTATSTGISTGKVMFLNKAFNPSMVKQNYLKRPPPTQLNKGGNQPPVKYTKIILSKAPDAKRQTLNKLQSIDYEPSTTVPMDIDLEGELVAHPIAKRYVLEKPLIDMTASYKTNAMNSAVINRKIKQAIEDMEDDNEYEYNLSNPGQ